MLFARGGRGVRDLYDDPRMAVPPPDLESLSDLDALHARLRACSPPDRVRWAVDTFGEGLVLTTSFGVQAAVMLHLVTRVRPDIPVVFVDTGYHFEETYRFADELTERLGLNLQVAAPVDSSAWFEQRYGKLWDSDIGRYNALRKVEPMERALASLGATATLAGLRAQQTDQRAGMRHVEPSGDRAKVAPILDWGNREVHHYLKEHGLPYHPLREQNYASIGDWHSTRPVGEGEDDRAGRFNGLASECGLHVPESQNEDDSRFSSGL